MISRSPALMSDGAVMEEVVDSVAEPCKASASGRRSRRPVPSAHPLAVKPPRVLPGPCGTTELLPRYYQIDDAIYCNAGWTHRSDEQNARSTPGRGRPGVPIPATPIASYRHQPAIGDARSANPGPNRRRWIRPPPEHQVARCQTHGEVTRVVIRS
jgi:hypothetical protein